MSSPNGGLRIGVLTVSDSSSRGEREDLSGQVIVDMVADLGEVTERRVVPDDEATIAATLREWVDAGLDFIATTGGTGISPRDVTPEATLAIIEREIPGLGEAMRAMSLEKTPMAMLSRAVCGTCGRTLIVNLPGSPKAVRECLEVVLPVVAHAQHIMAGGGH